MYSLQRYSKTQKIEWDHFVQNSKNGTFLLQRDYMDYHSDRFQDHSLMLYDDKDNLAGVFPANLRGRWLDSHGGLTYGGFITDDNMKTPKMLSMFEALIDYSREQGFEEIRYKTIPHIYHQTPAEEDLYALHICGARLISRNVITAVKNSHRPEYQSRRKRAIKDARKHGVTVSQSDDWVSYWQILEALLEAVHDAEPVHTLEEIKLLQSRFPENIKLYGAFVEGEMLAGIVIYESPQVARFQYIASSIAGQKVGALDYLIDSLLNEVYAGKRYIEFGTSEADNTPNYLNTGLINQKEGFGARAIMHDQYLISLSTVNRQALSEALA